jgi:hypothetical protein
MSQIADIIERRSLETRSVKSLGILSRDGERCLEEVATPSETRGDSFPDRGELLGELESDIRSKIE